MQNILPPPALQGDERTQLTQLYRYLFRLSEQLNMSLGALGGQTTLLQRSSGGGGALSPEGTDPEQFWAEADAQYKSLKSLIIKTANIVRAEMDLIVTNLKSEYVAVSEWGAYKESVSREIEETAKYTLENFEYEEGVLNIPEMAAIFDSYRIETTGYIKRGIIGFDEENFPIIGIAIGQGLKHKEVTVGGEVYEVFDETQNMATYAADKLSFWIDGTEVAYLSNSELVVTRVIVRDSIQLGDWNIAVNKEDGMTIQKRIGNELDLSGNNTITITADQISAIAKDIDMSANTSIKLTADQIAAIANSIDLSSNTSISLIAGLVEQKRRVFVDKPVPPYDVGDMWTQSEIEGGELMRCATAKASSEDFADADWVKASKYTDDTTANQALTLAGGGVASTDVEFYLSQSATELKGGNWQTVAPEWADGNYMWMRVKTTLKDGADSTSEPTCIAGATGPQGATGAAGVSITAVTEQYYLSSSKTTQTGGSWQTTQPTWSEGKYIWTRVWIDYSDGTWSYTKPYCDATWEVVNDVAVYSGSNPPSTPITTGKIWIDTGVVPTVIRRWKGTVTSTDRDDGGWDTVSDLDEINEISNKLRAQQAEAQKAIDRLATAITIDTEGAHFYKPGYRDHSEVRIDQDSVDILVGGNVNSSFIAGGLILGNYMLWHPAAAGGLAFNLV